MNVLIGTSGYAYKFWKGNFYPDKIKAADMLAYYAEHFGTVEINNTFYRMPKADVVKRWADATPDDFRFVIKASRQITHNSRLRPSCSDALEFLLSSLEVLGDKLGAILFQCPPYLQKDVQRLRVFLALLPDPSRAVMEFRHDSWFDEEVYALLRETGTPMCIGDYEGERSKITDGQTPIKKTAPWGYLRLRESEYDDAALQHWLGVMREHWSKTFVFFKHEENGPGLVRRLAALAKQTA